MDLHDFFLKGTAIPGWGDHALAGQVFPKLEVQPFGRGIIPAGLDRGGRTSVDLLFRHVRIKKRTTEGSMLVNDTAIFE